MIRDRHLTDLRWLGLHLRRQLQGTESGRAIVEFVFLGTLLLVPLVYLIMTLAQVQAAAYGATAAAREAGRAFTTAATEVQGMPRARAAAQVAFMDFGQVSAVKRGDCSRLSLVASTMTASFVTVIASAGSTLRVSAIPRKPPEETTKELIRSCELLRTISLMSPIESS